MEDINKLYKAIDNLQPNSNFIIRTGNLVNEENFNNIEWHSENNLTWSQVSAEMDTL